jgi:hypothetical protein
VLAPTPGVSAAVIGLTGWTTKFALQRLANGLAAYVRNRVPAAA